MHPKCFPGSTFGPCPDLYKNFEVRPEETCSIYWDDSILNKGQDDSFLKVAIQCEPVSVLDVVDAFIARHREFDLVLAHNHRILSECPNAKFLTESCCSFIDKKAGGSPAPTLHYFEGYGKGPLSPVEANYTPCDAGLKEFAVSYLTSSKAATAGHQLRQEVYDRLPSNVGNLRVHKHRSPPRIDDKRSVLNTFQYHICIENGRYPGYYSEKIVDAFVTKCVPVYNGAQDIGTYFNPEGVIKFDTCEELLSKLAAITPEYYASIADAIEENYHRALQGVHQWDILEAYITSAIIRKRAEIRSGIHLTSTIIPNSTQLSTMPSIVTPSSIRIPPRPLRRS
jgi:hypothetical protein